MEFRFRVRVENRLALEAQLVDQQRRRDIEATEDRIFREQQLEMLAERDRIDQMSDEKRRRKMTEHRKATHELLEVRKAERAQKLSEEIEMRHVEHEQEKRRYGFHFRFVFQVLLTNLNIYSAYSTRQEIVEEERIKIIQEHAEALMGFLPVGVLRDSDRKHLPMIPKKTSK